MGKGVDRGGRRIVIKKNLSSVTCHSSAGASASSEPAEGAANEAATEGRPEDGGEAQTKPSPSSAPCNLCVSYRESLLDRFEDHFECIICRDWVVGTRAVSHSKAPSFSLSLPRWSHRIDIASLSQSVTDRSFALGSFCRLCLAATLPATSASRSGSSEAKAALCAAAR